MKYLVNMLPTCILYCNAGPGCLNCWQVIMLLRIANIIFVLGRVYFRDSRSFTLRKLYGEAKIGQETKKGMANVQTIQTLGVLYVHQSHLAFSGTFFFVCFVFLDGPHSTLCKVFYHSTKFQEHFAESEKHALSQL